jgi:hypothetical protein
MANRPQFTRTVGESGKEIPCKQDPILFQALGHSEDIRVSVSIVHEAKYLFSNKLNHEREHNTLHEESMKARKWLNLRA